jgi:hypothetical protein
MIKEYELEKTNYTIYANKSTCDPSRGKENKPSFKLIPDKKYTKIIKI